MSATYIHTERKPGFSLIIVRLLAVLYFLGLAAAVAYVWTCTQNRYVSTAEFKISRQQSSGVDAGLVQLALPGLSDSGSLDSQVTIGYIASADLLLELEKEYHLREHYSAPPRDFVFRLDPKATLEDRLAYYRGRITSHFDKDSGMTVINVDTFDPKLSRDIAAALLVKSETFVNIINQQIAEQQVEFDRVELDRSAKKVDDINAEILALQNKHNFISPDAAITAQLKAMEEMKMDQLRAEADLSSLLRDSPNSPRIETIRSRIRSLNELMDIENAKLTGPEKDRMSQLLSDFKELGMKLEFAVRLRAGAEMMLEKNRVDAVSRSRFFSVIQNPYLPEDIAIPRRPYATAAILGLGLLVFVICRVLLRSVFERV